MNLDNFKLDARSGLYVPKRKARGAIPRPVRRHLWLVRVDGEVKALAALCDPAVTPGGSVRRVAAALGRSAAEHIAGQGRP